MQLLLKVGGVDKTGSMREGSLKVVSAITHRMNTCTFLLMGSQTLVEGVTEVILSNTGETVRYFAGYIMRISRKLEGVTKTYLCECQDYTVIADRALVNKAYAGRTDAYIINDLCATYVAELDGSTYVQSGLTRDEYQIHHETLRRVLDNLSSDSGMDWYIDYYKNVRYFTPETNAAPFGISDSPDLSLTYPCYNLLYSLDATKLVNRVLVLGGHYLSDDADFIMHGDGFKTVFVLPSKMHKPDGETEILVYKNDNNDQAPNWVAQGVGVQYLEELGGAIDVLHNFNERTLTFATAPEHWDQGIKIHAKSEIPVLVRVRSEASYVAYGRWFDDKLVNQDINSRSWAMLAGKGVLATSAFKKEKGKFMVDTDGLVAGQRINMVTALRSINGDYMINKVVTRILGGTQCQYEVSYGEYNPDLVDMLLALKRGAVEHHGYRIEEMLNELIEEGETLGLSEATDRHDDVEPLTGRWIVDPGVDDDNEGVHLVHEKMPLAEATARADRLTRAYRWQ